MVCLSIGALLIIYLFRYHVRILFTKIYSAAGFLLLLLICNRTTAQSTSFLQLERLTIDNGLSQGFVSDIWQDSKGVMWFTTSDGLNKYDGYTFSVYHHDPDDPSSIGSDDLTRLFEDSHKRLWIGTRHNGLDLFDRENNRFTHIRRGPGNSLASDNIMSITEDKTGNLWIRNERGIDRLEIIPHTSGSVKTASGFLAAHSLYFMHITLDSAFEATRPRHQPAGIFTDSRNHVYVTTNNAVWEVLTGSGRRNYRLVKRFSYPVLDSTHIAVMLEDTVNHCLLLNTREMIIKFPGYDFNQPVKLYGFTRRSVPWTIDNQQRLWFPDSNRMIQLHIRTGATEKILLGNQERIESLIPSTMYYTDRNGIVWLATGGYGIFKYNPEKENFHHILPGYVSYQLLESSPGKIVAIGNNGSYKISIQKHAPAIVQELISPALLEKHSLMIWFGSFTIDSAGDYWFAMHGRIIHYQLKTKSIRQYYLPGTEVATQPFPLYADKNNNIWMGYNRYFIQYNITSGRFTKYEYPSNINLYDYDYLQCIYEDKNLLWLGTINGLFRFNTINKQIDHFKYTPGDTGSLSNNFIFSLNNDSRQPDKYLWVGTKGGGMNRMNKETGKFVRYTTKNGLPNNVVYGILPDDEGNLWISTNRGLSAFDQATNHFRNFDVSDGLQTNEFNRYSYCRLSDGLLVFGGMNGINYFDPSDIKLLKPPEVILTDFRLFNKTVDFKSPGAPIEKEISFADKVLLQYRQNVITFQFAAMDYRKAGNARYRYMMESFDRDWIYSGTIREATYTNLDPGTYRFVVEASLADGVWSKKQTSIQVIVIPPWWRTWWFYTLAASGTLSVTYALYRYRLNQVLRLERIRNRIARDLHDEVGSSISTIAIYSKIIHEQLGSSSFNNEPLVNKISENTQEIMEAMNDIVWNINTKNDVFELIINRMREHAYQLFEAKGYTLHFNFDEDLARMKLSMEKRRDFYLIYKEALNNIAKYANGKNVWITMAVSGTTINLTIKDDGKGFDPKTVRKSSNGLTNMTHRTAALHGRIKITAAPGEGTEIRLSF